MRHLIIAILMSAVLGSAAEQDNTSFSYATMAFAGGVKPITPVDRLIKMENRKASVSSILVESDIKADVTDESGAKKAIGLSATVAACSDGRAVVKINYSWFNLVDFRASKNMVSIYFPRKGKAFQGTEEDSKLLGTSESRILSSSVTGLKLLFPDACDGETTGRRYVKENGKEYLLVYKTDPKTPLGYIILRKIYLDKVGDEYIITKSCIYDDNQKLCGLIKYEEYSDYGGNFIPSKITMQLSPTITLSFTIKKVSFNKTFKDNTFLPELAEDAKILTIDDMKKTSLSDLLNE